MKYALSVIFIVFMVSLTYGQKARKMKTVFDGTDFSCWQLPDGNIWWTIKDGTLWARSDPEQKGSILWTKKRYKDFVIQLDFKFGEGTIDSGVFMRGDDEKNAQIQIGISGSLKRDMTGSPYVPKKGYPVEAQGVADLLKKDDWNSLKAMATGNTYTVWLNGKWVMDYTLEDANLKGSVGLQLHPSRDMTIQFRNIAIGKL
ncbi:MAG: DUF1080 domain-containing protein [Bacteroidota bacterium]